MLLCTQTPAPRKRQAQEATRVYILASKRNGTLYVGVTSDLHRRMAEHKQDLIGA